MCDVLFQRELCPAHLCVTLRCLSVKPRPFSSSAAGVVNRKRPERWVQPGRCSPCSRSRVSVWHESCMICEVLTACRNWSMWLQTGRAQIIIDIAAQLLILDMFHINPAEFPSAHVTNMNFRHVSFVTGSFVGVFSLQWFQVYCTTCGSQPEVRHPSRARKMYPRGHKRLKGNIAKLWQFTNLPHCFTTLMFVQFICSLRKQTLSLT